MTTTIVSMYFNLKALPDASAEVRPMDFYLEKGRAVLSLPNPIVFFCDSETKPLIQALRDDLAPGQKTIYIEKSIVDYDFYKLNWPVVVKNRKSGGHFQDPRNTSSYFLLTVFKIIALQIAEQRNDFHTSHYSWLDFGLSHIASHNFQNSAMTLLSSPKPKVSLVYIHYRSSEELKNMREYIERCSCGIAASVITVEREYVAKLYSLVMSILYEQLFQGLGHAEEQILTYCYDRNPELFTLIYGDYYSQLTNYHHPHQDYWCIKEHFIKNALRANRADIAKEAAKALMNSIQQGFLQLGQEEHIFLQGVIG
jgi:hypothetical protein